MQGEGGGGRRVAEGGVQDGGSQGPDQGLRGS